MYFLDGDGGSCQGASCSGGEENKPAEEQAPAEMPAEGGEMASEAPAEEAAE